MQVHDSDNLHGAVLATPYAVPRVRLTDTSGAAADLADRQPYLSAVLGEEAR